MIKVEDICVSKSPSRVYMEIGADIASRAYIAALDAKEFIDIDGSSANEMITKEARDD